LLLVGVTDIVDSMDCSDLLTSIRGFGTVALKTPDVSIAESLFSTQ